MPIRVSLVIFFALGTATFPGQEPTPPALSGRLETVNGLSVLSLWGTPRERGFAHGWLLAEEILEMMREGLTPLVGQNGKLLAHLAPLLASGFTFSDDEIAEMEGLRDGIEKRFPGRKVPVLDKPLTLDEIKLLNTYGDWYTLGCSSEAVWGKLTADGKTAVVRNFDFMVLPSLLRWQHLRVVAPGPASKGRGWVGVGFPGSIAPVTAMNAEGVFVAIHDVWVAPGVKDYVQRNVPRLLAVRRLLEDLPAAGAVEKAAELCRSWNTLFGNNFLVATPDVRTGLPAGVLEYDTREEKERGVTLRGPATEGGARGEYLACSNGHRERGTDSCHRYDGLIQGIRERKDRPFDRGALEDLVLRAAVPAGGKPVGNSSVATLHEVIALTGERTLSVRFLPGREKNIADVKAAEFGVDALLSGLPRQVAAKTKAD